MSITQKRVTVYVTSDGVEHTSLLDAEVHELATLMCDRGEATGLNLNQCKYAARWLLERYTIHERFPAAEVLS